MLKTQVTPVADHTFIIRGAEMTSIIDIKLRQKWEYEENKVDASRVRLKRENVVLNMT